MKNEVPIRKLPPYWILCLLRSYRSMLLWLHRKSYPANIVLYERFTNLWFLPAIRVAAELDIAGILAEGPRSIEDIAKRTGSDPEALFRMMRSLASQDIFKKRKDGLYENTRLSKVLIDGKGSLRYMIMQHLGNLNWSGLNEFSYSIRTGKDAFSKVFGKSVYEYLSEHPQESVLFDRSMTNLTEIAIEPILNAINFSRYHVIADIGGGEGLLLSSILCKTRNTNGILFDLPEGMTEAGTVLNRFGVADRVSLVPGDFFKTAPEGADAYLLKNVLHNWSEEECVTILNNIRKAMPENGRILILEMILDEGNKASFGKLIDLQMLVFMESGKERTRKEFESLLAQAGLKISRIFPTIAPISMIEAVRTEV
ncbi:MAG: methyltransferase [Bacteroidetes bacterium]|nr:methyltransferase [Bacteroidota bacterium]